MTGSRLLTLSPEELAGDLPPVCVRTGRPATEGAAVRFARAPWWSLVPLGVLLLVAAVTASLGLLASWWLLAAVLLPLLSARGVGGRVPLSADLRGRLQHLRRRRLRLAFAALLLTWVAVTLALLDARAAGVVVLAGVVALYLLAVGTYVASRMIGVRGWPEADGGATLRDVHPDFVAAVEIHRSRARP